jgi:ABC-2 type transport system ATP-binding protein
MVGFYEPDKGDVKYRLEHFFRLGEEDLVSIADGPNEAKKTFGFAAQLPSFYPRLTCSENLDYFGRLYDLPDDIRKNNALMLLKIMGLNASSAVKAENLSGGMQKRLDIACALIHNPQILILDEPTADLDPILREQMWQMIKKINAKGTTIIISSHFLSEIETLCDRVGILHDGKIVKIGTPSELRNLYAGYMEVILETKKADYKEVTEHLSKLKELKIDRFKIRGTKLIIYTQKPDEVVHYLLHKLKDWGTETLMLAIDRPSLKEAFETFMSKGGK